MHFIAWSSRWRSTTSAVSPNLLLAASSRPVLIWDSLPWRPKDDQNLLNGLQVRRVSDCLDSKKRTSMLTGANRLYPAGESTSITQLEQFLASARPVSSFPLCKPKFALFKRRCVSDPAHLQYHMLCWWLDRWYLRSKMEFTHRSHPNHHWRLCQCLRQELWQWALSCLVCEQIIWYSAFSFHWLTMDHRCRRWYL